MKHHRDGKLWAALEKDAELSLVDVFGHDLEKDGKSATLPVGAGRASLGTLAPGYWPRIGIENDQLRCHLADPELGELNLRISDVSLHRTGEAGWKIDHPAVEKLQHRIRFGCAVLLSVGLARPRPKGQSRYWLQVNNIHLRSDPDETPPGERDPGERPRDQRRQTNTPWASEEAKLLSFLVKLGQSTAAMSRTLHRPPGDIDNQLRHLGLRD